MNLQSVHFRDVTNSQQVTVYEVRKRICLSIMHKNPGLTVTGEVSTLRPWSFASGNSSVVEHRLAKARVEGSNPFSRSNTHSSFLRYSDTHAELDC